jgi:hypothetical protein
MPDVLVCALLLLLYTCTDALSEQGDTCATTLNRLCGHTKDNRTMCEHCLDGHRNETEAANCSSATLSGYCRNQPPSPPPPAPHPAPPPPPPPHGGTCATTLNRLCGHTKDNRTMCEHCLDAHRNETEAANCSSATLDRFCPAVHPPPPPPLPPPPPPPITGSACIKFLDRKCLRVQREESKCQQCIQLVRNNSTSNDVCSASRLRDYCEAGKRCIIEQLRVCGAKTVRESSDKCRSCVKGHEHAVKAKNCSLESSFCASAGHSCPTMLQHDCSRERHNSTACRVCALDHRSTLEREANCSWTEVLAFCAHSW